MVFGFGGSDSEDEDMKKAKQEARAEALEAKKKAQAARRQRLGKKEGDPDTASEGEEEGKRPGRRPGARPGAEKEEDSEGDDEDKKAGRRPGGRRPGSKDDDPETDEEAKKRPGRPAGRRPGKKDDEPDTDEDEAAGAGRPGRPGHHGKEDDEEAAAGAGRPGRPGRHGKEEEDEAETGAGRPGRPGRHGKEEEEEEEPARPGHAGAGRPGRHGKEEEEEEPARPGHAGAGRPGRPGRHGKEEEEEEEPARPGHGRPTRPGHGGAAAAAAGVAAAGAVAGAAAAGHGKHGEQQQQTAPSSTTPMEVDHGNAQAGGGGGHGQDAEQAKIEAQRKKDQAERIRLQKIANNQPEQPQQPQQPQQHGGGGGGGGHQSPGGTVTVKCGESIQAALDSASPGTTIEIEAGTYNESLKSRVDGTKEQPIEIKGPSSGATAIIKGSDKSGTCVEINHDYYILNDFTIDGTIKENCSKDDVKEAYREKCLAIRGKRNHRSLTKENGDKYVSSVDGVIVKNMKITNCGGEGIRLRYFVTNCTLFHNRITSTGCYDFKFGDDQGIKNGEGIYIGTSSKQWDKNPTGEQDICRWNRVYENYIDTHGNECVDVKEGAMDTVIETNYCTGQKDEDSAGIDSRASGTTIRYNKVVGCKGAGVRLGGHKVGNDQYGTACKVYCNILEDNEYGGIKVMVEGNQICQNTISGKGDKYKEFRGDACDAHKENGECPFDVDPPSQDIETTKWFQNCKP